MHAPPPPCGGYKITDVKLVGIPGGHGKIDCKNPGGGEGSSPKKIISSTFL